VISRYRTVLRVRMVARWPGRGRDVRVGAAVRTVCGRCWDRRRGVRFVARFAV